MASFALIEVQRSDSSINRFLPWVAGIAAATAATATAVATSRGPGFSYSSQYVSAGLSLANTGDLRTYSGERLTIFPPGLPAIIALGSRLGLDADFTIRALNSFMFGLVVVLAYWLLKRHVGSAGIILVTTVLISVSLPLLLVAEMAWSEITFIALCLGVFLSLEEATRDPGGTSWLIAAGILSGISFTLRYSALALILVGGLSVFYLLADRKDLTFGLRSCVKYLCVSMAVPAIVMLRNLFADGRPMGPREPGAEGIDTILSGAITTFGSWITPRPVPVAAQQTIGIVLVILAVTSAAYVCVLRIRNHQGRGVHSARLQPLNGWSLLPLGLFVGVYTAYVIASAMATVLDPIGNRLLSPVYVPAVIIGATAADRLLRSSAGVSRAWLIYSTAIALCLLQGSAFVREARGSAIQGRAASSLSFRSSELVRASSNLAEDVKIVTNRPDDLWAVLRRPIDRPLSTEQLSDLFVIGPCEPIYLVWFGGDVGGDIAAPSQSDLEVLVRADEGELLRLSPASSSLCN